MEATVHLNETAGINSTISSVTNITSTVEDTLNSTEPSTTAAILDGPDEDEVLFKLGISLVILGALFVCALSFTIAIWYSRQKIRSNLSRQNIARNYTYDNNVDICQSEHSDTIALERAFGTGVLVIQDSPIVKQRARLTGTGTGPVGGRSTCGYMSTAESDTEHLQV